MEPKETMKEEKGGFYILSGWSEHWFPHLDLASPKGHKISLKGCAAKNEGLKLCSGMTMSLCKVR